MLTNSTLDKRRNPNQHQLNNKRVKMKKFKAIKNTNQNHVIPFPKPCTVTPIWRTAELIEDGKATQSHINQNTLISMLRYVRRAESKGERIYCEHLIALIYSLGYTPLIDEVGNIIVNNLPKGIDTMPNASKVMFTSHTDSVHSYSMLNTKQDITWLNPEKTIIGLYDDNSNCLGADDAVGNYIMLRLLQNKTEGLYVFFRSEEIGGIGSSYFANDEKNQNFLRNLTHCISFDRKGYNNIITHQFGRCASDEWAVDFAKTLQEIDPLLQFEPDNTGVFTDSANFTHLIPECTNLSVGYFDQHTKQEIVDVAFVEQLCEALEQVDFTMLSWYRDVADVCIAEQYDAYYDDADTPDESMGDFVDSVLFGLI